MRSADDIERLIRKVKHTTDNRFDARTLNEMQAALASNAKKGLSAGKIWRFIMESRTAKIAIAAVILLAVFMAVGVITGQETATHHQDTIVHEENVGTQTLLASEEARIKEELRMVSSCYEAQDADGLIAMLDSEHSQVQIASAACLGQIGGAESLEPLARCMAAYGGEPADNPFALAIAAIQARLSTEQAKEPQTGAVGDQPESKTQSKTAGEQGAAIDVLKILPFDTLFCMQIRNLDQDLMSLDQYLMGVSPVGATMALKSQAAGLLADSTLQHVNTQGTFAAFVVDLDKEKSNVDDPFDDVFAGMLIPFKDFKAYSESCKNCTGPDPNGVYMIQATAPFPGKVKSAVRPLAGYALLTSSRDYKNLLAVTKVLGSEQMPGLISVLGAADRTDAQSKPVWLYANVRNVNTTFGPAIIAGLEDIKREIANPEEEVARLGIRPAIVNIYLGLFDILLNELETVSIGLTPKADVFQFKMGVKAVEGTLTERAYQAATQKTGRNELLGYLQNGAICNLAGNLSTPFWQEQILSNFDIISYIDEKGVITDATINQLERLVSEFTQACKGPAVASFVGTPDSKPIFSMHAVLAAGPQFESKVPYFSREFASIWNEGGFGSVYAAMGMHSSYAYNGVIDLDGLPVHAGTFTMEATEPNSMFGLMIESMYGSGIEERFTVANGIGIYAAGSACEAELLQLADIAQAGGPVGTASEVTEALGLLENADTADFFGTYNYIRAMKAIGAGMKMNAGWSEDEGGMELGLYLMKEHPFTKIDVPTQSNLCFAGKVGDGRAELQIALPKKHLFEMQQAMQQMQKAMKEFEASMVEVEKTTPDEKPARAPGVTVSGIVYDAITGEPVAGVVVEDHNYGNDPVKGCTTDENGWYSYTTWAEEHSVEARMEGYETRIQHLDSGFLQTENDIQLDFDLMPKSQ